MKDPREALTFAPKEALKSPRLVKLWDAFAADMRSAYRRTPGFGNMSFNLKVLGQHGEPDTLEELSEEHRPLHISIVIMEEDSVLAMLELRIYETHARIVGGEIITPPFYWFDWRSWFGVSRKPTFTQMIAEAVVDTLAAQLWDVSAVPAR